jgi:DNA-binding response OmpR family regulator
MTPRICHIIKKCTYEGGQTAQMLKTLSRSYCDLHLEVDFEQKTVTLDSVDVVLTNKEFELLALLVRHAGELISRETLLQRVWGYSKEIRTRTLDVHVRSLRRKLCAAFSHLYIETVFGIGYRFQPFRMPKREYTGLQDLAIGA